MFDIVTYQGQQSVVSKFVSITRKQKLFMASDHLFLYMIIRICLKLNLTEVSSSCIYIFLEHQDEEELVSHPLEFFFLLIDFLADSLVQVNSNFS